MIDYNELKTALTDISNICRMTDCYTCAFEYVANDLTGCILKDFTPNNWMDNVTEGEIDQYAKRGAHLVEEGYIDE